MKVCTSTLVVACLAGTALAWPTRQVTEPNDQDKYQTEKQDAALVNAMVNHMKAGPGLNSTAQAAGNATSDDKPGSTFKENAPGSNSTAPQVQPYNATADPANAAGSHPTGHDAKEIYGNGLAGKMVEAPHVHKEMQPQGGEEWDEQCHCKRSEGGDDAEMMEGMSTEPEGMKDTMTNPDEMDDMMNDNHDMNKRMDYSQGMDTDGVEAESPEDDAPALEKRIEHSDMDNKATGNHDIGHKMAAMSAAHDSASKSQSSSTKATQPQDEAKAPAAHQDADNAVESANTTAPAAASSQKKTKPLSKRDISMLERFANYIGDLMDKGDETSVKPSNETGVASRAVGNSTTASSNATAQEKGREGKMAEIREAISESMAEAARWTGHEARSVEAEEEEKEGGKMVDAQEIDLESEGEDGQSVPDEENSESPSVDEAPDVDEMMDQE
ncbi:Dolichol kinase sec59 [Purpureocillium lavendulum]|uniref:Dolichol kinase sec59 n=1 Tax=Purpureocillium lavendulum TaxID=1247861 RepID=A0AB34FHJ0_9HYPO|nr:Dolichol kinase sec59 [Purpureocillium lavendulum]